MQVRVANKYSLKELHEEIDLFDRKIAHLQKFEIFETEEAKSTATAKLSTKRESLVKQARDMAAKGIEYDTKDLPRSFKAELGIVDAKVPVAHVAEVAKKTEFGIEVAKFESEQRKAE